MKKTIKCSECEYCKGYKSVRASRLDFYCKMPGSADYIRNYFKEHQIKKLEGFIGFGKPYDDKPQIKTSPAWCPKKGGTTVDVEGAEE